MCQPETFKDQILWTFFCLFHAGRWTPLVLLLSPVIVPCIILLFTYERVRLHVIARLVHYFATLPPRPLAVHRRRRLSVVVGTAHGDHTLRNSIGDRHDEEKYVNDMEKGLLAPLPTRSSFFKLPRELREAIWLEVVGDVTLHMFSIAHERRIKAFQCRRTWIPLESDETRRCGCWHIGLWPYITRVYDPLTRQASGFNRLKKHATVAPMGDVLSLMLTCREFYAGTVDILYSQPKFDFIHPATLRHFSTRILPSRLNAMQRVRLRASGSASWYLREERCCRRENLQSAEKRAFATFKVHWDSAVAILADMTALKEVEVALREVGQDDEYMTLEYLIPLLQSLLTALRKSKNVRVRVRTKRTEAVRTLLEKHEMFNVEMGS